MGLDRTHQKTDTSSSKRIPSLHNIVLSYKTIFWSLVNNDKIKDIYYNDKKKNCLNNYLNYM